MIETVAERVFRLTADEFAITSAELRGPGKMPRLCVARQIASWILHRRAGWSYPHIGRVLYQHHTTVLHSVRRVDALSTHPYHAAVLDRLWREVQQ